MRHGKVIAIGFVDRKGFVLF